MDALVDHYRVLGLPSGEEGAKLSEKDLHKAYKLKALELHPDKRPDDPNANQNFQRLNTSYQVLIDKQLRKSFDNALRALKRPREDFSSSDPKRQKLYEDLVRRERAASQNKSQAQEEEERIQKKLHLEIAEIRAKHATAKRAFTAAEAEAVFYNWIFSYK